jgi:hypothetical protein
MARTNSDVWYKSLQQLTESYNTRPHRTLSSILLSPTAPVDVTAKQEEKLRDFDLAAARDLRIATPSLPPGTLVRLLVARTNAGVRNVMAKKANDLTWTRETFAIVKRHGPNAFRVATTGKDPRVWPIHSLKVVGAATVEPAAAGPTVNRSVVSAKRLEALNISGEEQMQALAAPARAKRATIRHDYAKVVAGK